MRKLYFELDSDDPRDVVKLLREAATWVKDGVHRSHGNITGPEHRFLMTDGEGNRLFRQMQDSPVYP